MTSVNVTENKYSVSVTEGATTVVTVKAPGPQGPQGLQGIQGATGAGISAGDKGALTVAANLTDWTLNDSVVTSAKITDGAIVNADINASAGIQGTKISPDFGSQNITTTGNAIASQLHLHSGSGSLQRVNFQNNITGTGVNDGAAIAYSTNSHGMFFSAFESAGNMIFQTGGNHLNNRTLSISNSGVVTLQRNQEPMLVATPNAGVELYHDNVKKAETLADGIDVFNRVRCLGSAASIHLNSDATGADTSSRAMFGLADGANQFITGAGPNDVILNTPHRFLVGHASSEIMAIFDPDGASELYYAGTKKAETTADGFQIQDNLTISGNAPRLIFDQTSSNTKYKIVEGSGLLQLKISTNGGTSYTSAISIGGVGNIFIPDNDKVNFGSGNDLTIVHDGTDSKITNKTGNLLIEAKNAETGIKVIPDGSVELYHDNVKKVETTSSGVTVTGSVTTQDMNMSNLNGTANEVDNTKGSWSIQEGADDLFLINRVSGKKYKFNLTEIS